MKMKYWVIIVVLLLLVILWCLFFKKQVGCSDCPPSEERTAGVTVINCESKSLAKQINSAKDGEIIKVIGAGDCNLSPNVLPLVISNNNITLDFTGLTYIGQKDKDLLVVSGQGNIFQNAVFTKARNGVVVLPGANAHLVNISAVSNKGTGLCVIGDKAYNSKQNQRISKEKYRPELLPISENVKAVKAVKAVKKDVSTQKSVKLFCDISNSIEKPKKVSNSKSSFSLIKNAVASTHNPTTLTVCGGDWSRNAGNGGEIDAAHVLISCGIKKLEPAVFNNNSQNGLVVNGTSTVEVVSTVMIDESVEANNNVFAGMELDLSSSLSIVHSKFNTNSNNKGLVVKGSSNLFLVNSSFTSANNELDIEISSAQGDGSFVGCFVNSTVNAGTMSNSKPEKFFCPLL